jgi:ABC transporter fused permease/ATP-binding protein
LKDASSNTSLESGATGQSRWRIFALARPEAATLAFGFVFLVLGSATSLILPQGIRYVFDEGLLKTNGASRINMIALAMLGIFAVEGIASSLRYTFFSRAGERIVARLRKDLFASLMRQDIAFFDREKTGDLLNRLTSDTATLQNAASVNISQGLRSIASSVGGIVLLFWTSPKLAVVMLGVVPPIAILAVRYARKVRGLSRSVQDALAESTSVAEESLAGIRTVRSFTGEEQEVTRFGKAIEKALTLAYGRITQSATFFSVASFSAYAASALVFWYGGHLVIAGEMTIGGLGSFLAYSMVVAFSLASLADLWADFNRAFGASDRVFQLLDQEPKVALRGGATLESVRGELRFADVTFAYPMRTESKVLSGFSLSVAAGNVVALVGSSGAGKSTVATLLYRLYEPDAGRIELDGASIATLDPSWLRSQVGVVSQEPILFSTSIADNIRYGRATATDAEVEAAAKLANAHTFIVGFPEGYRTPVGERGTQLSGGQKQRIAIARAILKDPRVLVLDEATSALDAESEHQVREAIERLMKGRTTLVIAHRLSTIRDANAIVVMEKGKIVEQGTHAELLAADGAYKRLVERQNQS